MGLIGSYNLRSMVVRKGTAAMTAGGIAMVVAVFVMTLAIAQGFRATLVASGSPSNAIVLRKGATAESTSGQLSEQFVAEEQWGASGGSSCGWQLLSKFDRYRWTVNTPHVVKFP